MLGFLCLCLTVYAENVCFCKHGTRMYIQGDMGPTASFSKYSSELRRVRARGDYQAALNLALDAHGLFPDEHALTWYWRSCLLSLLGRSGEALDALRAGLAEGEWWKPSMMEEDADLDCVRDLIDFSAILEECETRYRAAQASGRPQCTIISPSSGLWEPQSLLLLHTRGGSSPEFRSHWLPLVDEGWTLVSLQSSQPLHSGGYCWDDADRARREISDQIEECRRVRGMDLGRLVIAGASQGARMAFEVAQAMAVPWLCVIPAFPAGYDSGPFIASRSRDRGAFLLGAEDPANERTRHLVVSLKAAGAEVRSQSMPGVGHELPDDLAARARESLEWIRASGRAEEE